MNFFTSFFLKFTLQLNKTYSINTIHKISSKKTYYIYIITYNKTLKPSKPIYSNKITITTTIPKIKKITISNTFIKNKLITNNFKSSI